MFSAAPVTPYWEGSQFYTYINWEHPDQEDDVLSHDMPGSWNFGDELYLKQRFDNKKDVQFALKRYSMQIHQTYRVVISTPAIYAAKCVNADCPFRLRAIVGKNSDKWVVKKWVGRHTCVNQMLTQHHNKCDSEFISSCIIGTFLVYGLIVICIVLDLCEIYWLLTFLF